MAARLEDERTPHVIRVAGEPRGLLRRRGAPGPGGPVDHEAKRLSAGVRVDGPDVMHHAPATLARVPSGPAGLSSSAPGQDSRTLLKSPDLLAITRAFTWLGVCTFAWRQP
jgi:hypothetical protein